MLFDEALALLIQHLDATTFGTLRINVDHGLYKASFATGVTPCEGEPKPVLTDALTSLLAALDG